MAFLAPSVHTPRQHSFCCPQPATTSWARCCHVHKHALACMTHDAKHIAVLASPHSMVGVLLRHQADGPSALRPVRLAWLALMSSRSACTHDLVGTRWMFWAWWYTTSPRGVSASGCQLWALCAFIWVACWQAALSLALKRHEALLSYDRASVVAGLLLEQLVLIGTES
jgi:hypothetical protein